MRGRIGASFDKLIVEMLRETLALVVEVAGLVLLVINPRILKV